MDQSALLLELGNVIRVRRKDLGYSQEGFAAEVGLHRTYMGDVERGERNLTLQSLLRIANGLAVTPSELLQQAESQVS